MIGKRGSARQWSNHGGIDDSGMNQVYFALRDSVDIQQDPLPDLDGPTTIFPPEKHLLGGGPLPNPIDVRAVLVCASGRLKPLSSLHRALRPLARGICRHLTDDLPLESAFGYSKRGRGAPRHRKLVRAGLVRALAVLDRQRFKRPELRYLKLALRRHLELEFTLDQAFGYVRATAGPAPFTEERQRHLAVAVFEQRFVKGLHAEVAGHTAGEQFDVSKTQALETFDKYAYDALQIFKVERLRKKQPKLSARYSSGEALTEDELHTLRDCRLWTTAEQKRIKRYFDGRAHRGPRLRN